MGDIKKIFDQFNFEGEYLDYRSFGSGHINTTYIVRYTLSDGSMQRYVVQKINQNVFKDTNALMNNVFSVTSFLREKIRQNGGDENRETLHFTRTRDGEMYCHTPGGDCYRAYVFVKDSVSFNSITSEELFQKSGAAFGKFQKLLADFPAGTLNETIPHFHDTAWRYENEFLSAINSNRAAGTEEEIAFVNQRKSEMSYLTSLIASGKVPLHVTHNDTKLNNVLFDAQSNDAICIIDLDTVMPGLVHYDFGDAIRFGANNAAEDEQDLSKVSLNLDYFKAYAKGFINEAGESLNACEIGHLAFSAKLMTLECGMRFLTDYLNGDTYFKTDYPQHNLVRARNQFKLVSDMESKMQQMNQIIKEIRD